MKKNYKIIIYIFCFTNTLFFIGNNKVLAAGSQNELLNILQKITSGSVKSKTGVMDVPNLALNILIQVINLILYALPVFALIMIMYAGIQYIFSAGNPTKSGNAVKLLNSAILGFAAFLMLLALWNFMISFVGVDKAIPTIKTTPTGIIEQ